MSSQTIAAVAGTEVPRVPTQLYIDGQWQDAAEGGTFAVIAPTTEQQIADVAAATAVDVDRAVRAARAQVDGGPWSRMTGAERGVLLHRLADLIERDLEIFVTLEAVDVGRPAFEPRAVDIPNAIDAYRHFAGWADKIDGRALTPPPAFGRERFAYARREPVGVLVATMRSSVPLALTRMPVRIGRVSSREAERATLAIVSVNALAGRAHQPDAVRARQRIHRGGPVRGRRAGGRRSTVERSAPGRMICGDLPPSSRVTRRMSCQANDTVYGLGAYLWTSDLSLGHRLAARLRAGTVWINGPGAPDARLPWGGMKTSGVGRELGFSGIEANTEEKTVTISL